MHSAHLIEVEVEGEGEVEVEVDEDEGLIIVKEWSKKEQ